MCVCLFADAGSGRVTTDGLLSALARLRRPPPPLPSSHPRHVCFAYTLVRAENCHSTKFNSSIGLRKMAARRALTVAV